MALGLTQPQTEMSTSNISWGKGLQVTIVLKSWSLKLLEPSGPVPACIGIAFPLPLPLQLTSLTALMSTAKLETEPSLSHFATSNTFPLCLPRVCCFC